MEACRRWQLQSCKLEFCTRVVLRCSSTGVATLGRNWCAYWGQQYCPTGANIFLGGAGERRHHRGRRWQRQRPPRRRGAEPTILIWCSWFGQRSTLLLWATIGQLYQLYEICGRYCLCGSKSKCEAGNQIPTNFHLLVAALCCLCCAAVPHFALVGHYQSPSFGCRVE